VFVGRVVHFVNEQRRTAHPIVAATREGEDIILTTADDVLIGRAHLDEVTDESLMTQTALPLAPIYRGCMLADARFQPMARVAQIGNGKITLAAPLGPQDRPAPGDDVWLINVGPGDTFELPALVESSE
jgi:hypothetical protein